MRRLTSFLRRESKLSMTDGDAFPREVRRLSKDSKSSSKEDLGSKDTLDVHFLDDHDFAAAAALEEGRNGALTFLEVLQILVLDKEATGILAKSVTPEQGIRLRFCHAVSNFSRAETKAERLIRGKYIINTLVADGNIFDHTRLTVEQKRLIKLSELGGNYMSQGMGDLETVRDQFLVELAKDALMQQAMLQLKL